MRAKDKSLQILSLQGQCKNLNLKCYFEDGTIKNVGSDLDNPIIQNAGVYFDKWQ